LARELRVLLLHPTAILATLDGLPVCLTPFLEWPAAKACLQFSPLHFSTFVLALFSLCSYDK